MRIVYEMFSPVTTQFQKRNYRPQLGKPQEEPYPYNTATGQSGNQCFLAETTLMALAHPASVI